MSVWAMLLAAQAVPQIASERIDEQRVRLSISSPELESAAAAQAALMPTARRLCGAQPASFRSFRFRQSSNSGPEGAERPQDSFEQEVFCGAAKATAPAAALLPPDWQPSAVDQQAVLAASYAYFHAKDAGRYAQAWSMLSSGMKEMKPAAVWQRDAAAFNQKAGAVQSRRVTEITWYNNPPGAPRPGLYVATDFSGEFEKLDSVCGYLMWLLQPDGSFVLTREEQNLLDNAAAKNVAKIDRQPLRVQMGCKD